MPRGNRAMNRVSIRAGVMLLVLLAAVIDNRDAGTLQASGRAQQPTPVVATNTIGPPQSPTPVAQPLNQPLLNRPRKLSTGTWSSSGEEAAADIPLGAATTEYRIMTALPESALPAEIQAEARFERAAPDGYVYSVSSGARDRFAALGIPYRLLGGVTAIRQQLGKQSSGAAHGGSEQAGRDALAFGDVTQSTGDFLISSGNVDDYIPDGQGEYRWLRANGAPANAQTTNVFYRLRVHNDPDPTGFYCGDYEIYLSSEATGGGTSTPTLLPIYINLGGYTDGGYDDDAEDNSDIYLNWRQTSNFNGENPNQAWYVYIIDSYLEDSGYLGYIEFHIYWSVPDVQLPDLQVPEAAPKAGSGNVGEAFNVRARIYNGGTANAAPSHTKLYLSTDNDFDVTDDWYVGEAAVGALAAGSSEWVQWDFPMPSLCPAGASCGVWVVFVVDSRGEVQESDEDNTWKSLNTLFTINAYLCDLRAPEVIARASTVGVGDPFYVQVRVHNAGAANAPPTHVRLYLSTDNDFDVTDDTYVGELKVDALAGGASQWVQREFAVPNLCAGATCSVWTVTDVDSRGEVQEADESNYFKPSNPVFTVLGGGASATPEISLDPTRVVFPIQAPPARPQGQRAATVTALDINDPAADLGEVSSDEVVVRFSADNAARLHASRNTAAGVMVRNASLAPPAGLPATVLAVRPFVAGAANVDRRAAVDPLLAGALGAGRMTSAGPVAALSAFIASDTHGPAGLFYARIATGADPRRASQEIARAPGVVYAHPSPISKPASAPNDALYLRMWNLDRIRMPAAWDISGNTLASVRVCVVDTGVRISHSELAGRTADAVDVYLDNGDAYADTNQDNDDEYGHGTSCAGIIGAIRDNGSLVAGVAPVTIIPVNGYGLSGGSPVIYNYTDGIFWGVDHAANVISLSLGGHRSGAYQTELDAAAYAESHGVVVVAAAGNEDGNADNNYPSAIPYYIAVGALDDDNLRVTKPRWWWGSNFGQTLDVVAPGQGDVGIYGDSVLTLSRTSNVAYTNSFNGTSSATPQVAGVAALLKHVKPSLTALQIRDLIESTARDAIGNPAEDTAGWDQYYGHGLIDADAALRGTQAIGEVAQPFRILNEGNAPLLVTGISLETTAEWISWSPQVSAGSPLTIPAGGEQRITITINPAAVPAGTTMRRLAIESNDPDENHSWLEVITQTDAPADEITITSALAGRPNPVAAGNSVNLTVAATDSLGHPVAYHWTASCPALGAIGTFIDAASRTPLWVAPANQTGIEQSCTIQVTATDGFGQAATGSLTQRVSPQGLSTRFVRVKDATAAPGADRNVPIEIVAQGNENAIRFSIEFDPAVLNYPSPPPAQPVTPGTCATAATITADTSQVANGRLGVAVVLPGGQTLPAGTCEFVLIPFVVASTASSTPTTIVFGDQPTLRLVSDAAANTLAATWVAGTFTPYVGYEADVAPRGNGGDGQVTTADWLQVGRFVAGLDAAGVGVEFQQADCAPRSTLGNGTISAADWVQAGRYAAGLDPRSPTGGPSVAAGGLAPRAPAVDPSAVPPEFRIDNASARWGHTISVPVKLVAQGNENAAAFTVSFDPAVLTYVGAAAGVDTTGATVYVNDTEKTNGRVRIALALPGGQAFAPGLRQLVVVKFQVAADTGQLMPVLTTVGFGSSPTGREVADVFANPIGAIFAGGLLRIQRTLPAADFDADGQADIVWRNRVSREVIFWLMNGTAIGTEVRIPGPADRNWNIAAIADFNNDGNADLVWRHARTGANQVWYMSGTTFVNAADITAVPDTRQKILAAADFNADDNPDLLWSSGDAAGDLHIWYMNGTARTGQDAFSSVGDAAASLAGVGDFNADGHPDLLWHNPASGETTVWYLDGATRIGDAALPGEADTHWMIAQIDDFNHDAAPDIVWHNLVTGENKVTYIAGTVALTSDALPAMPDAECEPVAAFTRRTAGNVSDFNADGNPDILWHNKTTGEHIVWYMSGATLAAEGTLPADTDLNWRPVADADFDGDGLPDIVWRNAATGQNRIWLMTGRAHTGDIALRDVPNLAWTVIGAGDFNRDGHQDLVWCNDSTGACQVWFMHDGVYVSAMMLPAPPSTDFRGRVVGDVNGDGWPEVVYDKPNTLPAATVAWVNGAYGGSWLDLPTLPVSWQWELVGAADFDGDGIADLLWRHYTGMSLISYVKLGRYGGDSVLPSLTLDWWNY